MHPDSLNGQLMALWEEALREDFGSFLHQSVNTLNPGAKFLPNWHLQVMGEYLQAVECGQMTRLIINMPPRYLKSLTVSVAWPAWLLGRNPAKRVIVASYAANLSLKHSLDCRTILAAPWFQKIYPKTRLLSGQNEKHKYMTTDYGFRLATSVGGTVTGEGGDILIVDDPLNPSQADSSLFRNLANRWFDHTFSSRLNDKRRGGIVVVMQRLHSQDLSGYLHEKGNWEMLELAAIAERTQYFRGAEFDYRRPLGECLHPQREDAAMLARVKHEMGSYAFAAQYQQQPLTVTGGMVKPEWLGRYAQWSEFRVQNSEEDSQPSKARREAGGYGGLPPSIIQSWDTAIKTGANNDPSVCITFAQGEGQHYVLDVLRERLEYPQLRRKMIELAEKWKPQAILVEDKASGQSLLQDLRQNTPLPLIPVLPKLDKITRFASITPQIEAGRLLLPQRASWLAEFEQELLSFPDSPHDDQVDALSQYLGWIRARERMGGMRVRRV